MNAVSVAQEHAPTEVERLLRALPDWFGIEEAVRSYVEDASVLASYVARIRRDVVGAALIKRHYPHAAELYLIAVDPGMHGQGVGSALVEAMEADLRADGVRLWQVKTVAPSFPDEHYARTRPFYRKHGFLPLEEMHLREWDAGAFLVSVKPL